MKNKADTTRAQDNTTKMQPTNATQKTRPTPTRLELETQPTQPDQNTTQFVGNIQAVGILINVPDVEYCFAKSN